MPKQNREANKNKLQLILPLHNLCYYPCYYQITERLPLQTYNMSSYTYSLELGITKVVEFCIFENSELKGSEKLQFYKFDISEF